MAYASVASLLQTLDSLLKLTRSIFKIMESEGDSLVICWQYFLAEYSRLCQTSEEALGVVLEMKEIQTREIQRALQHLTPLSSSRLHQLRDGVAHSDGPADLKIKLYFNNESPELARLSYLERQLMNFIDDSNFSNYSTPMLSIYFPSTSLKSDVQKSILISQEFKNDLTFLCHLYIDITVLYHDLAFLMTCLDDFSKTSDDLLKSIKDVADRAKDVIEEFIVNNHEFIGKVVSEEEFIVHNQSKSALHPVKRFSFGPSELRTSSVSSETRAKVMIEEESIVHNQNKSALNQVKRFFMPDQVSTTIVSTKIRVNASSAVSMLRDPPFNGNNIHGHLLRAFEEIQPIKVLITGMTRNMNHEKISLQSSSISLRGSKQETVVGFDDEQKKVSEGLNRLPSALQIVTIVGMGGIGKTTLAKKVLNDPYTCYDFDCHAWITISQVYQLRDLLLGLLSSFSHRSDIMIMMQKSDAQLAEDLHRSLKGKRYLIVMDDMWSIDAWNDLKRCFPDDKTGSRIIVTSRLTELANNVNPNKRPHFVKLLDTERSWELLEKLVFGIAGCSPELVDIGKEIAKRCRGLPLAIVVIAGILRSTSRTLGSWKHIANNLSSIVSTDPEQCLDVLSLSYIYLPHHLRACFLYMGAFPEDCEIQMLKLINLWVAEGFIFSDNPKHLEQIAEEYLEDLISRNLVLVEKRHFGGKVKSCRLHDFIREVCLREAQKENFMNVVQRGSSNNFPAGLRNQRRLSFHLDPYSDVAAAPPIPRVLSFLCFTLGSDIVPDILFFQLEFRLLRVLDVYFLHFEYFPQQILKLIHLRYLAVKVSYELPAEISQLRNLQTFVIQGPWLYQGSGGSPTLLLKYWRMPSLRHIQCSVACQLWDPSTFQHDPWHQFAAPEYLQTLSIISFSSCRKEVFSVMPGLKRLQICETLGDYSSDRSCFVLQSLVYLQELETLKCCFYVQNKNPRRLSCLDAFPYTLRKLSLSWSYLPWEDMTPIAILPNLQVLKLKNHAFQGPEWMPTEEGFHSLKHLLIENTNLIRWVPTLHQFPSLQNLILKSCKHLEEIPFGIDVIGSLLRIEVHNCSKPIENLAREIQELVEGVDVLVRSDRTPDSHSRSF